MLSHDQQHDSYITTARAAAIAGGATGALVVIGWYAKLPLLTRLAPNFVAMQFNTAVSLVLVGIALYGLAGSEVRWTRLPALLVFVLGALTLLEHLTGVSLGIDLMQFRIGVSRDTLGWLADRGQPAPGRMAPNTALSLTLLGFALAFGRPIESRRSIAVLRFTCCLAAAVLGFVAFTGYILGIPTAYGWGNLSRMAVHTAAAVTVLGIGSASGIAAAARRGGLHVVRWAPFAAGAVGIAISLSLWQAIADFERSHIQSDMRRQAQSISDEVKDGLAMRARVLAQIAADPSTLRADSAAWRRQSVQIGAVFPDIRGIGWIGADATQWSGDSAPSDVVRAATARSMALRGPALSRPFVTSTGDIHVLIATATGGGTAFLVFSPQVLSDSSVHVVRDNATALEITDAAQRIASHGYSEEAWARAAETRAAVNALGRLWQVRARPTSVSVEGVSSGVPIVFLVTGLLASLLAFLMIGVLQRERAQASALATTAVALAEQRDAVELANQAKSAFLARMSHELRTPLNSVIGFAGVLIKRDDAISERDRLLITRIQSNGIHLLSLVNQVLDIAKIESGRESVVLASVDVRRLTEQVTSSFLEATGAKGVRISFTAADDIPLVVTDSSKLTQVLMNLIGNAIKFTTPPGEIAVRVSGGDRPRIEVQDHGIGIAADRLDAIFEEFEQADAQISQSYGGTGLGLTISKRLCELMGHSLSVHSTPGSGSTFTVWLTSIPSAASAKTIAASAAPTSSATTAA